MTNPYLPKLGPAAKTALPGLPRRSVGSVRGELMSCFPTAVDYIASQRLVISCVCIGAGGGSVGNDADDLGSGGGGGLSWANNIIVNKGDVITLTAGISGQPRQGVGQTQGFTGGTSDIKVNGVLVCRATGGGAGDISTPASGGTNTIGDGGATGGAGASATTTTEVYASGGGTAGYSGTGGAGIASTINATGNAGAGGGGGSGGIDVGASAEVGGSGGVDVFGEGASGGAGSAGAGGGGGSGGEVGESPIALSAGRSGMYGAGGSVGNTNSLTKQGQAQHGAPGAVRIIWGSGRSFPSTDVGPS